MNTIYKTKADIRAETEQQVALFLSRGGVVQIGKPRKIPKSKMSGKTTRSGSTGTSGFAVGFPSQCLG